MKSIMQQEKECYICGGTLNLHNHHIYFGHGKRSISDKHGFTVWLCWEHHEGKTGVHLNREIDLLVKKNCQLKYESTGHSTEEFIKLIGRNYK